MRLAAADLTRNLPVQERIRALEILVDVYGGITPRQAARSVLATEPELSARAIWALSRSWEQQLNPNTHQFFANATRHKSPVVKRAAYEAIAALPTHVVQLDPNPDWLGALSHEDDARAGRRRHWPRAARASSVLKRWPATRIFPGGIVRAQAISESSGRRKGRTIFRPAPIGPNIFFRPARTSFRTPPRPRPASKRRGSFRSRWAMSGSTQDKPERRRRLRRRGVGPRRRRLSRQTRRPDSRPGFRPANRAPTAKSPARSPCSRSEKQRCSLASPRAGRMDASVETTFTTCSSRPSFRASALVLHDQAARAFSLLASQDEQCRQRAEPVLAGSHCSTPTRLAGKGSQPCRRSDQGGRLWPSRAQSFYARMPEEQKLEGIRKLVGQSRRTQSLQAARSGPRIWSTRCASCPPRRPCRRAQALGKRDRAPRLPRPGDRLARRTGRPFSS